MLVAVKLATNYEKISRRATAPILLSKHISCIAIETKSGLKKLLLMSCSVQDNVFRYQRLFDEKVANEVEVEAEIDIIDTRRRPDVPMQMKSRQK
jgi:hypothetical protein